MKYKRNNKIKSIFKILFIVIILLISIVWIVPTVILKNVNDETIQSAKLEDKKSSSILQYNLLDLFKVLSIDIKYDIEYNISGNVTYTNNLNINVATTDYSNDYNYNIQVLLNSKVVVNRPLLSKDESIQLTLDSEGQNDINIKILKDGNTDYDETETIYYIIPYQKQFLDELSNKGVQVHYRKNNKWENYNTSISLIKNLGAKYIRADIFYSSVNKGNQNYDFTYYDSWINEATDNNLNIILEFNGFTTKDGEKIKFDTDEEFNEYYNFISSTMERYPQIKKFEILNEPNYQYTSSSDVVNYSKLVEISSKVSSEINQKQDIISGGLALIQENTNNLAMPTNEFFDELTRAEGYKNSNAYSYHPYDGSNYAQQNVQFKQNLDLISSRFNDYGGFLENYVTEYGISVYSGKDEETQAKKLLQQSVLLDFKNVDIGIVYNFWNTGNDKNIASNNYGVVNYDYTPKKSYFALKNYYENTNGAEYIGTINLSDGLEAHVYDKDGKPKIIAWSTSEENTIELPYENFTASDIYGNEIENTDGTLEITTSPVYLDDISDAYFYEAISNTALERYSEFEEKFEAEIANINGLQEEINTLKQYMVSIASNSTEDEHVAIEQMNTHFNLGNVILSAYKNGSLDVEYVKLSSMLDMLNDIGNSYEDLLTVCATTRAPYYTATEELINSAESKINNNSDLEIVYPSKILDFAKELDEKSEYINSLSEENDIKTGLIVSNSLHAYYLSDWANEFASIYIDEYIEANPVTVSYSNTDEWTNQDVTATLNIGNDATVTNNGGSNTYIFKSNGSFTFEYERRGQAFKLEAKVSNIDKTYPTITGVKDGQTYTNSVKPVIEDTNLSIVSISYNGENMEYYDGITLEDEGMYSIVATDRAGNTTTVEFNIISDVQDEYVLQGNYLLNVWQETTLANFKNNYTSQEESYIIKRNDTELTDTDIIATGDIIELSSGDTYTIVVAGDINCDGRVTVFDLSALRRYILKQIEFTEIELLSADINIDGNNIGAKDYSRMRLEILGMH